MPKNITREDVLVDPVALWLNEPLVEGRLADVLAVGEGDVVTGERAAALEAAQPAEHTAAGMYCTQCGVKAAEGAKFCGECGTSLRTPPPVVGAGVAAELASRVQARPADVASLTPQQRAARERQHTEALKAGQADPPLRFQRSTAPEKILIHFVEDGHTWAGVVWMRGQEIEIGPDHPRWEDAQRWINLTDAEQMEQYGKIKFRRGPWPGRRSYQDAAGAFAPVVLGSGENAQVYTGPTPEELRAADAAEARRGRAVPALPF